jgi:hypothetical protein
MDQLYRMDKLQKFKKGEKYRILIESYEFELIFCYYSFRGKYGYCENCDSIFTDNKMSYTTDDYLDTNDTELDESNPFRDNGGLENYDFPDKLKDRLSDIYDLLDEVMEDPDNDPSDYSDMFDFASVVISQVVNKLRDEFGEDFEEYEDDVDDYLRNNEDETIFDYYNSHSGFDNEDDEDEDYNF